MRVEVEGSTRGWKAKMRRESKGSRLWKETEIVNELDK